MAAAPSRGVKRPTFGGPTPAPAASKRRVDSRPSGRPVLPTPPKPPQPPARPGPSKAPPAVRPRQLGRFVGEVISYDKNHGYGFVRCAEVPDGDIYFKKPDLPPELQSLSGGRQSGLEVLLDVALTPDGKPRGSNIEVLAAEGAPGGDEAKAAGADRKPKAALPPLEADQIDEMTRFLEETGGHMDYGKFANKFAGVKKQQLEPHFQFVKIDGDASGRWAIALDGLDPKEVLDSAEVSGAGRGLEQLGRITGTIANYDPDKGYGFVKAEEVPEKDIYFKKASLAAELQPRPKKRLVGLQVELDVHFTPDGKPRGTGICLAPGAPDDPSPAIGDELPPELVDEMSAYLDENGGYCDFRAFTARFPGTKKAQVEPHFQLVQPKQGGTAKGRWRALRIALHGADVPEAAEEDAGPGAEAGSEQKPKAARKAAQGLIEPSPTLWLIGCVKKWDEKKGYGFLVADGADDVFVHRNDLPPEMPLRASSLVGAEVCFELVQGERGKLQAKTVRALIGPDGKGGWRLRRA